MKSWSGGLLFFLVGASALCVGCAFGYPADGGGESRGAAGSGGSVEEGELPGSGGAGGRLLTGGGGAGGAPQQRPDDPAPCAAAGENCMGGLSCCGGTYCTYVDYAVAACVPAAADGEACAEDVGCVSGRCGGGSCRATSCAAAGGGCSQRVDEGCCEGFCTSDGTSYVAGVCAPPQPGGAYCEEAYWCQSYACVDWQCL